MPHLPADGRPARDSRQATTTTARAAAANDFNPPASVIEPPQKPRATSNSAQPGISSNTGRAFGPTACAASPPPNGHPARPRVRLIVDSHPRHQMRPADNHRHQHPLRQRRRRRGGQRTRLLPLDRYPGNAPAVGNPPASSAASSMSANWVRRCSAGKSNVTASPRWASHGIVFTECTRFPSVSVT